MKENESIKKLELEASRLSSENNPRNIGIDILVYAIAQLIKSLDKSDKTNKLLTYIMIGLTAIIALLTVKLVFPKIF